MNKKPLIASLVILSLVIIYASFYYGKTVGEQKGKSSYAPLVDLAFPKPPKDIRQLSGIVKGVYGATIDFEINSVDDYLPHLDGTPQKKEIRHATVTSKTTLTLIDSTKLDSRGNPKTKTLSLSDIKPGMGVTVQSNQNIRNVKEFDASSVQIVQ